MHRPLAAALAGLFLVAALAPAIEAGPQVPDPPAIVLERVATGLSNPLFVTHAGDASGRIFVVEQAGRVKLLGAGTWLDISGKVLCCGERGLLGLAFAPDFETSGRLYVSYSRRPDGAATLERLTVATPPLGAPATSGQVLLTIPDVYPNHNGGMLAFGPDGYLYWSTGDGGGAGDPQGNGQNLDSHLGKILRLDVAGATYSVPPTNPFASGGGRPEIWAYGLRNPWRFSFDRATGDLWIADVGQNLMEEINFQPAGAPGGRNYGWDGWEGVLPYVPDGSLPDPRGRTFPVLVYPHTGLDCSVTGGYRYRGAAEPALGGWYLYADFCSGRIWAATEPRPGVFAGVPVLDSPHLVSSFGEDENGEMYLTHLGGSVHRIHAS